MLSINLVLKLLTYTINALHIMCMTN